MDHEPTRLSRPPTSHPPPWPCCLVQAPRASRENRAGASSPMGLGRQRCGTGIQNRGLAFLVFDWEIKFLGSRFTSSGEVLLVSGDVVSAGGCTGFAE